MKKTGIRIAGGIAGLVSGLFGGGGGMVLLPLTARRLSARKLYPTCMAVMFPVCALSAAVYLSRGGVTLSQAAPYLSGGLIGGMLGGWLYPHISTRWLRRLFALFLIYAGIRYLL